MSHTVPVITGDMSALDAAVALANSGFPIFPVDHPELPRCAGIGQGHDPESCTQRGKHPAVAFTMAATTEPKMITTWFAGALRNIGIYCKDLVVIDEDTLGELDRYARDHQVTIPATMTVATFRGRHYYFWAREDHPLGSHKGAFADYNIDVKAGNAYVVGPGSLHAEGGVTYMIENAVAPVPVPDWIIDAVGQGRPAVINKDTAGSDWEQFAVPPPRGLEAVPAIIRGPRHDSGGERHDELIRYACSLRSRSVPYAEAELLFQVVWARCEQPPTASTLLPWTDAQAKLRDVYTRYPEGPSAEYRPEGVATDIAGEAEAAGRRMILTSAADIKPRRVQWLWEARLALGTLGLLAGREGVGKSTLAYWLVAQVTRGTITGEHLGQPRAVLVCATEDSWEHTIVPRLIAADADLSRVFRVEVLNAEDIHVGLTLPKDLHEVQTRAQELGAVLLLLDPLTSRIDANLDTHKDAEVRRALEPLVTMADLTGMAVLGIIHHNKTASTDPLQLVMASKAFPAVARSVHTVMPDPDDDTENRRLFGTPKNNLGRTDLPTRTFTVASHPVETDEGTNWTGRLVWGEDQQASITESMRRAADQGQDRSATSEAADWLVDYLTINGGTVASTEAKKEGADAGHSSATIKRAMQRLRLVVSKSGFQGRTTWSFPSRTDPDAQLAHQSAQPSRGEFLDELVGVNGGYEPQSAQLAQVAQVRETGAQVEPIGPRPPLTHIAAGHCPHCRAHIDQQGHRAHCPDSPLNQSHVPASPGRPIPTSSR